MIFPPFQNIYSPIIVKKSILFLYKSRSSRINLVINVKDRIPSLMSVLCGYSCFSLHGDIRS